MRKGGRSEVREGERETPAAVAAFSTHSGWFLSPTRDYPHARVMCSSYAGQPLQPSASSHTHTHARTHSHTHTHLTTKATCLPAARYHCCCHHSACSLGWRQARGANPSNHLIDTYSSHSTIAQTHTKTPAGQCNVQSVHSRKTSRSIDSQWKASFS